MQVQLLLTLRGQVAGISLGTVFLVIGLAACGVGLIRSFRGARYLFFWQGIFAALYGARVILREAPLVLSVLPQSTWHLRPYAISIITYLILIPALLFWLELSRGKLKLILRATLVGAVLIGAAGIGSALVAGPLGRFMSWNNLLSIWTLVVLVCVNAVPSFAKKWLIIQSPIAAAGVLISAVAAIATNLESFLGIPSNPALEPLAIGTFFLSLVWVAAEKLIADQRRLLSIENELAVAREIQNSILPGSSPGVEGLRICAAYRPMTAIAGDFYEFILIDQNRVGILVADVSGHGVPAALIAAMIKVAMQSVVPYADDPRAVLRGLNRSLSGQLRGQFVTASYLLIDTEGGRALYSAAGHPPLLRWRDGKLEPIESNGILFGVIPDPDYPVREIPINSGDRFLLYTDGVIEPENLNGEPFGDRRLEQIVRNHHERPPSELLDQLLGEIRRWQPASLMQEDDITLLVIDVV
ncbi:MAG TPA: PP2C family protein-serine/threonine phosphatase [Acidobacteriaceae bacterium]|jgi:sigma-B regulation protein RsbU (phosphoserine phosphatase)